MTDRGFMRLCVESAIAQARCDVLEHGFALPRARFVLAGPVPPIEVWPHRPPGMSGAESEDWFLLQLTLGRVRIADEILRAMSTLQLPGAARAVLVFMDAMPRGENGVAAFVEIWNPHLRVCEARGALPYIIPADGRPELGAFELIGHTPGTPITQNHLN